MADNRKKRMSMLDSIASAGSPAPSMMPGNRALRSARDAVDAHHVWELDPNEIDDLRIADRLDPSDIADLRESIEANGQTVPVLVRRNPEKPERYLLVYGGRRLEAIRASDKVQKVRALIASLDDSAAVRAQVSENTGRRDLSFIERALFAHELLEGEFGSQAQVAEVLNVTKSAISMALTVARAIGPDLAKAIGPAHGVGRPRWEALVQAMTESGADPAELIELAETAREKANGQGDEVDTSRAGFDAVSRHLARKSAAAKPAAKDTSRPLALRGKSAGTAKRTKAGVRIDIRTEDAAFADWLEAEAQTLLEELHARWKQRS